jgi:hypothetical protein
VPLHVRLPGEDVHLQGFIGSHDTVAPEHAHGEHAQVDCLREFHESDPFAQISDVQQNNRT